MKIGIIGSGAIGLYYGARLQRAGEEVHFLMRSDYVVAKEKGVTVKAPDGEFTLSANCHETTDRMGVCDVALITMKTTGNAALSRLLEPVVGPGTLLVTLQNGLGNDRLLRELYPENVVLGCLCFICLNRTSPGVVENFHLGSVGIGPYDPKWLKEAELVGELFRKAGVETRINPDLRLVQWKKLVWNVPFNGLSIAAGGVTTDVIVASPELTNEARALMDEIIEAAGALGMSIKGSFAEQQIEQTRTMGAYKPSSMIDFVDGKAVETEAIWGEPLRQAKEAGVAMPKLELLYGLLKQLCRA